MLRTYKKINSKIFKAQELIVYLVCEVWCKADQLRYKTRLNEELKSLVETHEWFEYHVKNIYRIAKDLTPNQKDDFKNAFLINNEIEKICNLAPAPVALSSLDKDLVDALIPFFKELYTKFLGWVLVSKKYGQKKEYYDELILENEFVFCPCCGYGDIKTYNQDGHSPFDHYFPLKHYPFSAINFDNLFPLCHTCNSSYKGDKDVLKAGKKLFYPFSTNHLDIRIFVTVDKNSISKLVTKTTDLADKITNKDIKVELSPIDDRVKTWDSIFRIKSRYLGKIADHRVSWLDDVRAMYRKTHIESYERAFSEVITDDSNKYLGFLKAPFLKNIKSNTALIQAMTEVSGDYIINR